MVYILQLLDVLAGMIAFRRLRVARVTSTLTALGEPMVTLPLMTIG